MHHAVGVIDHRRWPSACLGLRAHLHRVSIIGAQCNSCGVHIAAGHCQEAEFFPCPSLARVGQALDEQRHHQPDNAVPGSELFSCDHRSFTVSHWHRGIESHPMTPNVQAMQSKTI